MPKVGASAKMHSARTGHCNPAESNSVKHRGPSTELMPSIMGAVDAIIENSRHHNETDSKTAKKTHQVGNFAHLSPAVQKILSHVPDQELSRHFSSEETLSFKRSHINRSSLYSSTRSVRSPEKSLINVNKSTESLDIISPNVQKMISNFPDAELVISPGGGARMCNRNGSFLHSNKTDYAQNVPDNNTSGCCKTVSYHSYNSDNNNSNNIKETNGCNSECDSTLNVTDEVSDLSGRFSDVSGDFSPKPLGTYLHTSYGIASRTPVGRKNMGKFLQVPSESTNSTLSSEVSRPVSLTSLGSCSSSGSSGPHQPSSVYLASAESLDSDPEPTGSQGSADSGIAEQPTMSPEARVLQEVLDTETVYVADLNEVIQGYLLAWKNDTDCPLAEHLSHLFNNLEEIYNFNRSFLDQLRDAQCNPTKTANVFIQNDAGFSVYNEYCTNYPRTMNVLGELTRNESMASQFREKQLALGHALPLGSYLLKPVQRILKYHLLLQRLSKQCEPSHKPAVDLALTTMTSVASGINTMKRKHEHAVRVHEIQAQLYGWSGPDLTALGELVAEGTFRVNGARGRRHVFLFDKVLLMAKSKQDGALAYKSHITCSNLMLVEQVRGEPLSFQILPFDNPRLQCTLRARSPQHKREWTLQIKRVILENYQAVIPNHARQLVMQLGQDVQDSEDTTLTDKWSPLNNKHSTPHYLERRTRVRKSRDGRRAASQDRSFPSLGSWRRKSEPAMALIPQYTAKAVPKKIYKLKKAKESGSTRFYTDLSDSENNCCEELNESLETLPSLEDVEDKPTPERDEPDASAVENNLEKIVSDLLMQHEEFSKIMNRPRRMNMRASEPEVWHHLEEDGAPKVPSKADSLPRSFQLNDQIGGGGGGGGGETNRNGMRHQKHHVLDESLKENPDADEQHENDLASQLDDNEYPVHKIYRKTAIRFSLVQRIRALVSEEERERKATTTTHKYPLRKQGSKSMGEKIAHPDYADPQKLFPFPDSSCTSSRTNLNESLDLIDDPPERLDMTISESEVLKEFEKRLNGGTNSPTTDTGQGHALDGDNVNSNNGSSPVVKWGFDHNNDTVCTSSQTSDSYYESMLDKSLVEEYTRDENGKLVAKQDSFKNSENTFYLHQQNNRRCQMTRKESSRSSNDNKIKTSFNGDKKRSPLIMRPTKAPPPIPTKPNFLANSKTTVEKSIYSSNSTTETIIRTNGITSNINSTKTFSTSNNGENQNGSSAVSKIEKALNSNAVEKSWVKAMVGRFE